MKKMILVIPLLALISACSSSTIPQCSDPEVIETIKEIATAEMINQLGPEVKDVFNYNILAIRTTDENKDTGAYECAAQLEIYANTNNDSKKIPITYTVEKVDNGEDFYVNVFGLR